MEIKEVVTVLEEALGKPEDDGLKTKYAETIAAFLKENKSSDELVSIVVRGIDLDRASNYFDYLESVNKNDLQSVWKQIRESKTVSENKDNKGLKLLAGLLSLSFMKVGNIESQCGNIITRMISMIDDDKHPISDKEYTSVLIDFFVEEVLPSGKYPEWESFKIPGAVNKRLAEVVLQITAGADEEKYKSIRQWANRGIRFAEELIEKEQIESKIPESKVSDLFAIAEHYRTVEKQVRDDEYELARLGKVITGLQDEIDKLNLEKKTLESEISSLNGDVAENQKKIAEREKEIEERKKINDAADALKRNDEEGLLRDIANDLKAEYRDFADSENDAMDEQLGEIYREKLRNIFKILAKKGIRME